MTARARTLRFAAYSLLELSIVIVALGFLVGAVVAGQSVMRGSRLQYVVSQYQNFRVANRTFYDKYKYLAGDFPTATDIWGAANASTTVCGFTTATGTLTCNGNGDGALTVVGPQAPEQIIYWRHLSNEGLIDGSYTAPGMTGNSGAFVCCQVTEQNSPAGRIDGSLWMPNVDEANGIYFNFQFGGKTATTPTGAVFTPSELWSLDTKLDDGMPNTGKVVAAGTVAQCMNGTASTDTYTITYTDLACYGQFYTDKHP